MTQTYIFSKKTKICGTRKTRHANEIRVFVWHFWTRLKRFSFLEQNSKCLARQFYVLSNFFITFWEIFEL
jgi:hypothetical protein